MRPASRGGAGKVGTVKIVQGRTGRMEAAYVLIQCDLGGEAEIISQLAAIPEVREVRGTYGIYDVFCKIQADSRETLDSVMAGRVRKIGRIRSTITLHSIPSQGGRG